MGSEHLIDPDLRAFVAGWPRVTLDEAILRLARQSERPLRQLPELVSEVIERRVVFAPQREGGPDVGMMVYRPRPLPSQALPCIYQMHGGGFVAGSAEMMDPMNRALIEALGCALVSVDYRLAPETIYPGPLSDCYAGLAWLYENAGALSIDPARIGVMGGSAGGGLAAALALLARDRGDCRLAFQHLTYPMLDDRPSAAADRHPFAGDYVWTAENNRFGWCCYLGVEPGSPGVSPYAAAARAEDLTGLPPTFLSTGALDLFIDEDVEYARRLIAAGVPTELHVYPGAVHGFELAPDATVTRRALRDSRDALSRFFSAGRPS